MIPLLTLLSFSIISQDCLPATGDRILARDLAQANPAFVAIPGTTVVGFAPLPGVVRKFTRAELESIARQHHVAAVDIREVCFSVPQRGPLRDVEVTAAMRRVLPSDARLAIVELPKDPVPAGDIVFPLESLDPPQPGDPKTQTWKGYVRYSGNRRMPVWARVSISVEHWVVCAKRSLRAGETVSGEAVALESRTGTLKPERLAADMNEVVGKTLLRAVKAGEPLAISALERAVDVHRGDIVKVEVVNGSTRLLLTAVAEGNARRGDAIQLRNPQSGRTFRALIRNTDSAVVMIGKPE